jgi:ubiquinone/menaquinone biosynthesis C-methylase UbiE
MIEEAKKTGSDVYVLETGDCGAARLQMQDEIYGASTRKMMLDAGLSAGMRVLDLACGTGIMSHWIATQVGPTGCVIGGDISRDQLAYARAQGTRSETSRLPEFVEVNAYDTGLPLASFDMVHCRLLLCHLERPADALREIYRLLKPGGVLVCQDLELSTLFSRPSSKAYEQSIALGHAMGKILGVNYDFGTQLHSAVMQAGFRSPTISFIQPVHLHGTGKDWWHQTFAEITPVMIRLGITTQDEISVLLDEMKKLTVDEQVLLAQARMPAVSTVK